MGSQECMNRPDCHSQALEIVCPVTLFLLA